MRKLAIIGFSLIWLLASCSGERGGLLVTVAQVVPEEQEAGSAALKSDVTFNVTVAEEDEFTGFYSIYDSDGALQYSGEVVSGSFTQNFTQLGDFSVTARIKTRTDWGEGITDVKILSSMAAPQWEMTSKSVIGGETGIIDLTTLDYQRIDLRIVDEDTAGGKVIYFNENVTGTVSFPTRADEYGNFKVYVTVYDDNGNFVTISDQLIVLNPNDPIEILLGASENDPNVPDSVLLSGTISSPNDIVNVMVERTSYYGREEGISPLAEPKHDGDIDYTKAGTPIISRVERYNLNDPGSLITYDPVTEKFSFVDPMPYHGVNGEIEETGFKWSYAKFDREAWKYIKRKKHFDMRKALSIEYKIYAESTKSNGVPIQSAKVSGYPYLSTRPMGEFCLWIADTALNRLYLMQVPRFCWGRTMDWVASTSRTQEVAGNHKGYAKLQKTGLTSGWGQIYNYSDFEGIEINTRENLSMDVSLEADNLREISFLLSIKTPIYPTVDFDLIKLGVRDYGKHWGMWVDDYETKAGATGSAEFRRAGSRGSEVMDTAMLLDIFPLYRKLRETDELRRWLNLGGNGYDVLDYKGITHHETDNDVQDGINDGIEEPPFFTKINYLYPPTGLNVDDKNKPFTDPMNSKFGNWYHRGEAWEIHYIVE